jgi:orotidine-5'-phosphate decarboxylase
VASPHEITPIRKMVKDPRFIILTPGVRPAGSDLNDQRRVMTPAEALRAGANFLVVGRPITAARDPVKSARKVLAEMEDNLTEN